MPTNLLKTVSMTDSVTLKIDEGLRYEKLLRQCSFIESMSRNLLDFFGLTDRVYLPVYESTARPGTYEVLTITTAGRYRLHEMKVMISEQGFSHGRLEHLLLYLLENMERWDKKPILVFHELRGSDGVDRYPCIDNRGGQIRLRLYASRDILLGTNIIFLR